MALGWAALTAALAAAPFVAEALRPRAHQRRDQALGRFADLDQGWTHFQWHGEGDRVAVCIHGLTTPSFVWDGVVPLLTARGYRVLTYDLFGRGFSAAAPGRQDSGFFLGQLRALLDHEALDQPLTLVGYSMGGSIATAFAARHPDRVERLVLVASAGLGHVLKPVERLVQDTPLLGDWLMLGIGGMRLRRQLARLRGSPSSVRDIFDRQIAETRQKGFLPAVLSSQRHMLREDRTDDHRAVARTGIPVAAVWGGADDIIPLSAKDRLAALNPAAEQTVVPGATHGLPHTHPHAVAALL